MPDTKTQMLGRLLSLTSETEIDCSAVAARFAEIVEHGTGALSLSERDEIETHLQICGCCQEELAVLRAALESDAHGES